LRWIFIAFVCRWKIIFRWTSIKAAYLSAQRLIDPPGMSITGPGSLMRLKNMFYAVEELGQLF